MKYNLLKPQREHILKVQKKKSKYNQQRNILPPNLEFMFCLFHVDKESAK